MKESDECQTYLLIDINFVLGIWGYIDLMSTEFRDSLSTGITPMSL